jgi:hypothetical protein
VDNLLRWQVQANIKQDVQGLNFINSLNPITYTVDIKGLNTYYNKGRKATAEGMDAQALQEDLKTETAASKIIYSGFVAQDVEEAAKKLGYEFSGVDKPESKDGLYGLRYADFVVPLVKAVQELSKENEELKKKDEDLRKEVAELRQMMLELKNGNTNTINSISGTLEQNSPNPFTSSTAIRYYVPQSATSARLTFTNAKGQLVKTISLSNRGTGQLNLRVVCWLQVLTIILFGWMGNRQTLKSYYLQSRWIGIIIEYKFLMS